MDRINYAFASFIRIDTIFKYLEKDKYQKIFEDANAVFVEFYGNSNHTNSFTILDLFYSDYDVVLITRRILNVTDHVSNNT